MEKDNKKDTNDKKDRDITFESYILLGLAVITCYGLGYILGKIIF